MDRLSSDGTLLWLIFTLASRCRCWLGVTRVRFDRREQDRVQDGDPDRDDCADYGDHVQPVGERLPGRVKQRRAQLTGQLLSQACRL